MQRNIRVLVVKPNELPEEKMIKNTLQAKQEIVHGLIECVYLENDDSVVLICNEEGKLNGLPINRDIGYDMIAGNMIIAGDDFNTGEFVSLTDNQIEKYKEFFNEKSIEKTNIKLARIIAKKSVYEI
ncbi:MAG: DUF3846 domain-containing protein [Oscillospiraceae bacterium]